MNKTAMVALLVTSLAMISGCATITTGLDQSIMVRTEKDVRGASCDLTDSKGRKWYVTKTPGTVSVRKGAAPLVVVCNKEGFNTATLQLNETVSNATIGNLLVGGGIGLAIDAASGAAQKYPPEVSVWMEPLEWESGAERAQWLKEKREYEAIMGPMIAVDKTYPVASSADDLEQAHVDRKEDDEKQQYPTSESTTNPPASECVYAGTMTCDAAPTHF